MTHVAAIYCRISQDREGAGLGVKRQRHDCEVLAQQRGWTVGGLYVDNDMSAYSGKPRPEYERMLADIQAGAISAVVAWHADRLHRRPVELERFIDIVEAHRVLVATCTGGDIDLSTSDGRFTARVIGSAARKESEDKSRRTRRKHLELAQDGKVSGGGRRPFGFEADRVTVRESEAAEIRDARDRVFAGESLRGIVLDWRARGVASVTGVPWTSTTVKRLLCSGRISGQREHRDPDSDEPARIMGPAVWAKIIEPEDTIRLRAILRDPARANGAGNAVTYLLSGFVLCATCGIPLQARAAIRRKGGRTYRYRRYHCAKDRGGCDRVGISAARLEEAIEGVVLAALDGPALAALQARRASADDSAAIDQVQRLEAKLEQWARDCALDLITRAEYLAARTPLLAQLNEARTQIARHQSSSTLDAIDSGLRARWPQLSLERKRAIIGTVIESVSVAPTTRANNRFDISRVLEPPGGIRWKV